MLKSIVTKSFLLTLCNYFILLFALLMPITPYLGKKVLILILILSFFVIDIKLIKQSFKNNSLVKYSSIFTLIWLISIVFSENTKLALRETEIYLIYFFIPIILISTLLKKDFINKTIIAFAISMFINLMFSILILFKQNQIFGIDFYQNGYLIPFQTSHMPYSVYLSFSFFIFLFFALENKYKIAYKIIMYILLLLFFILLFITTGRTGQVTFLIGFIVTLLLYYKINIKYFILSIITLIFVLFFFYNFSDNMKKRTNQVVSDITLMIKGNNYSSSLGVRALSYKVLYEMNKKNNLLIGIGIGDDNKEIDLIQKKYLNKQVSNQKGQTHNTFVTIIVSLGIIGFLIFLKLLYNIFRVKKNEKLFYMIKLNFICSTLVILFTNELFGQKEFMFFFALFSSLIILKDNYIEHQNN